MKDDEAEDERAKDDGAKDDGAKDDGAKSLRRTHSFKRSFSVDSVLFVKSPFSMTFCN